MNISIEQLKVEPVSGHAVSLDYFNQFSWNEEKLLFIYLSDFVRITVLNLFKILG